MKIRATVALTALAAVSALAGCATVSGWFGRSAPAAKPAELSPIAAPAKTRVLWQGNIGAAGKSVLFPALAGNTVWAAAGNGQVGAFSAANGGGEARFSVGQGITSGVAANNALVVVGTPRGELLALDRAGKTLWQAQAPGGLLAPPVIEGDRVIVRVGDGAVHAFDVASGKRVWVYQRSAPSLTVRNFAPVVVHRGTVYAGFPGGRLVALTAANGGLLWDSVVALPKGATELERVADLTSPPVVDETRACAAAFQGRVACFDATRGTAIWARDLSSFSGMGADARNLYVTDDKSAVSALDKSTGGSVWKQDKLFGRGLTRPLAMGRYVIVGDYQGYVHLLSREDGSFVGRVATDGSAIGAAPVALDLTSFLVQTRNGGLYAIALE
ncbi:MAG: outer membrane protein assembly factor BamB [Betaproteobacteria bacterium]|nr:outer membrane protein assembly factor BamB [Betaproteobacteria bacterium]